MQHLKVAQINMQQISHVPKSKHRICSWIWNAYWHVALKSTDACSLLEVSLAEANVNIYAV